MSIENRIIETIERPVTHWKRLSKESFIKCGGDEQEYKDYSDYFRKYALDPSNLCYVEELKSIYYIDVPSFSYTLVYPSIYDLDNLSLCKKIKQLIKYNRVAVGAQDYFSLFSRIPNNFKPIVFIRQRNELPVNLQSELFIKIYKRSNFSYEIFSNEIVYEYFKHVDWDKSKFPHKLEIYRGIGSKSQKNGIAWTTDWSIAFEFATRGITPSLDDSNEVDAVEIYSAVVNRDNVLYYFENESEVVVDPEHIVDKQAYSFIKYNLFDFMAIIEGFSKDLRHNLDLFDANYFIYESNIHGYDHISRVLLLVLMFSKYYDLIQWEKDILIYCALLHDIDSINDKKDDLHGRMAIRRIEEEKIDILHLDSVQKEIAHIIIEYHSLPDQIGYGVFEEKELVDYLKLFNIFKDCDNLDRVRLGRNALSICYLRTDYGKMMPLVALQLLEYGVPDIIF